MSKLKAKQGEAQLATMGKDLEILQLKAQLFRLNQSAEAKNEIQFAEQNYQEVRAEIEKFIEMPLKDCVIDDHTYEIKVLDTPSA